MKPYPSFGGQQSFLILQESQRPLFQRGRILSTLLDIPRPVPLYYISCLLGSVCGVDFLPGYLYFPSTMGISGHVSSGITHRKMSVGGFQMVRFVSSSGVVSVTLCLVSVSLDIIIGYSYWTSKWNIFRSLSGLVLGSGSIITC